VCPGGQFEKDYTACAPAGEPIDAIHRAGGRQGAAGPIRERTV
jgi:hypothetical protein